MVLIANVQKVTAQMLPNVEYKICCVEYVVK